MNGGPLGITRSLAAANPVLLPKPEPRTMREQVVVPAIRRRNVAGVQRPGIRDRVHALQPLDFGNGPLRVHPSHYLPEWRGGQSGTISPKTLTGRLSAASREPGEFSVAFSLPGQRPKNGREPGAPAVCDGEMPHSSQETALRATPPKNSLEFNVQK